MNEPDEYDTLIAKRLPCDCGDRDGRGGHFSSCAAYWREEVAELLRERRAEIEQLTATNQKLRAEVGELEATLCKQGAEIERLRAEWNRQFTRKAELIVEHDSLRAEIERLTHELEAYAWGISPPMAQAKIDQLNAEIAKLKEQLAAGQANSNAAVTELIAQCDHLKAKLVDAHFEIAGLIKAKLEAK